MPRTPEEEAEYQALVQELGQPATPDLSGALNRFGTDTALPILEEALIPTSSGFVGNKLGNTIASTALKGLPGPAKIGTLALEGLLSAGGELANQELGITPESDTALAIAGAAPVAGQAIGTMGRRATMNADQALPLIHEIAHAQALEAATRMRPGPGMSAKALYTALDQHPAAPNVMTTNLRNAMGKALRGEDLAKGGGEYPAVQRWLNVFDIGIRDPVGFPAQTVPFRRLEEWRKRLGAEIAQMGPSKDRQRGALEQFYKAINQDYDDTVRFTRTFGNPDLDEPLRILRLAQSAQRRELAVDDLEEAIGRGLGLERGEGARQYRAAKSLKYLEGAEKWQQAIAKGDIPKEEAAEIVTLLRKINRIANLPPTGHFGSGNPLTTGMAVAGPVIAGGVAFGQDPMVSLASGVATGAVAGGWKKIVAAGLSNRFAREYLKNAMLRADEITPVTMDVVANILRATAMSEEGLGLGPDQLPPPGSREVQLPPVFDIGRSLPSDADLPPVTGYGASPADQMEQDVLRQLPADRALELLQSRPRR